MKKSLLQACLMVGSVLVLGAAANAQIHQQYSANVPFDFQAAGKSYDAGQYKLVPIASHSSIGALAILDVQNGKMRLLGQTMLGRNGRDEKGKLVFIKKDGQYTLSAIATPTFELKMRRTETSVKQARNSTKKIETVAINPQ